MNDVVKKGGILIVDDQPENLFILGDLLKDTYRTRVAISGEKALEIVRSEDPPDLVLLDIEMPETDGFKVCRIMKSDTNTSKIPVIFITARTHDEDQTKGFEVGAVDYIMKPFNPIIVRARVNTHVELKRNRDTLENLSYIDSLTGMANRRHFEEFMENSWNLAMREKYHVSLIMMDLDHFKHFNDHYGHQAGDSCLKSVAVALSRCIKRKTDIIARYGGEEFVCFLQNTKSEEALILANDMRQSLKELAFPHGFSPISSFVTISQGIASVIPPPETNYYTLIVNADLALYRAKENGRNQAWINTE